MYIKLDENMNLAVTINESLYRGDRRNRRIIFLIPHTIGEVDAVSSTIYMNYVRPDGTTDVALLIKSEVPYNAVYDQYIIPVKGALTHVAGDVVMWIEFYNETSDEKPVIAKSNEVIIPILDAQDVGTPAGLEDEDDTQLTIFQQLLEALEHKADDLSYNEETNELRLKSGENEIGSGVTVAGGGEPDSDYWHGMDDVPSRNGGAL